MRDLQISCYAPRWFAHQCQHCISQHRHPGYGTVAHYLQQRRSRNKKSQSKAHKSINKEKLIGRFSSNNLVQFCHPLAPSDELSVISRNTKTKYLLKLKGWFHRLL